MSRAVTLFTGQWADLPLETMVSKAKDFGYDGVELACWGDHFEIDKADANYCKAKRDLLEKHDMKCFAISTHLVGQAVCDNIDERHKQILPDYIYGDGEPESVRQRAAEEVKKTAIAAKELGVSVVNGFTGSSIWHLVYSFPPNLPGQIDAGFKDFADRWGPIMDVFQENGIKYGLEVHPTEIAFDIASAERALEAIDHHPAFGFNYDPSHLGYQGVDYANANGVSVLITDHHMAAEKLPEAVVVNPNQLDCTFPSKTLAGVGVAYYVLIAFRAYLRDQGHDLRFNLLELIDIVALGTVADCVPLDKNNRLLVHQIFFYLRKFYFPQCLLKL